MRNYLLNLYRITNLSEFDFSYKLVDSDLTQIEGKEDLFNKQLKKISLKVSSVTSGPTAIIKRNEKFFIAIPADKYFEDFKVDVSPFRVSVKLLPEVHYLQSNSINDTNSDVVYKFLDFEIRRQLNFSNELWRLNTNQFFLKRPVFSNEESTIEVFGGFTFKLVKLVDGNFYICLDLATKYIDKYPVSHYLNVRNVNTIGKEFIGKRFLYCNGGEWYPTEIVGFRNQINEAEFSKDGKTWTVYDYIKDNNSRYRFNVSSLLKPSDITILYKYPGRSMEPHNGASSFAKRLYSTNDNEVKSLHKFSIKDPTRRFELINKNITRYFINLKFNNKQLMVSKNSLTEKINSFNVPELKFNNDKILKVGHYSTGASASVREFGNERKQYIVDNGVLNKSSFDEQFLIVPDYLDKELIEAFKKNIEWQLGKLASSFTQFKIIRYRVKENQSATFQIQEIETILKQLNALSGFALFLLPDLNNYSKKKIKIFHDCLKSKFYPGLKVQCVSSSKIKSFFHSYPAAHGGSLYEYRVPEDKKNKFRSYLFNLVMEHLIINRKWPFALSKSLHYDIYIGIDVHERYAGFTFFFKNGEHIFFFSEQVPKKNKSQRAEKLKANLLNDVIYEKLKMYIPRYSPNPNGIVIIRDGRSFGEEERALKNTIDLLHADGLVNIETLYTGIVDMHKQSAVPFRIATQTNSYNNLENPIVGSYKLFNNTEGFIFNTGYPFQIPGSAKPLHLSLKSGNVQFLKVMEDIFCQSMLAFSAPDRSNSLPITIKLIDSLLEPLAVTVEIGEDENEEIDELVEIN